MILRALALLVAVAAAGTAAWLARDWVGAGRAAPVEQAAEPQREVLVAARDLALGSRVAGADLVWRPWPADDASAPYLTRAERPEAQTELEGFIVRSRLAAGEPILPGKLVSASTGLLAALLGPGERAVAVRVTAESSAGGFVLPGDRVDVLQSSVDQTVGGGARTVLRNVEVLAIDQTADDAERDAVVGKTATLRVSALQAEALLAAEIDGRLSLALRAFADHAAVEPAALDTRPAPQASPPPVEKPARVVLVRRAGASETVELP